MDSDKPVQQSFKLILFVAIIVSCLSFIKTDFSIGNFKAKKIDFFSDLKTKPVKKIKKIAPPNLPRLLRTTTPRTTKKLKFCRVLIQR